MSGREIEFKFKVQDEAALDAFAASLGQSRAELPVKHQRNTFFDSPDGRLRSQGLSLRLRLENGSGTLTIKGRVQPRTEDQVLVERFEAESAVAAANAEAVLNGSLSPLACLAGSDDENVRGGVEAVQAALGEADLAILGSFENERVSLTAVELEVDGKVESIVFELDRTSFPHGRVDCEIEAEIGPEADAEGVGMRIYQLLADAGVDWTSAPSKLKRFVEILEQSP